jgi:hypothetical protein
MNIKTPFVVMRNASAPGPGILLTDPDYRKTDARRTDILLQVAATTGTPVFALQPQQSLDGTLWHAIGSPITEAGLTQINVPAPLFQVTLVSISGGAVTVTVA